MTSPALVLGTSTVGLALLSWAILAVFQRSRWIAVIMALPTTGAAFLWAAWLLRGQENMLAWHLGLAGGAIVVGALMWRRAAATRWFGSSFTTALLMLVVLSAFAFPAYLQNRLAEASKGKPFCVIDRDLQRLTMQDVTFLGIDKVSQGSIWSPGEDQVAVWFPLTAYVRTGEAQLRSDYAFKFEYPPGLYDLAVFNWSRRSSGFSTSNPSKIEGQIPCIPQKEGLHTKRAADLAEYATAWGDFLVPTALEPGRSSESYSIRLRHGELLDVPLRPDEETAIIFLSYSTRPSETNRVERFPLDRALKAGFQPQADDSHLFDDPERSIRMRYGAEDFVISELECWKTSTEPRNCDHTFVAIETEAGFSTSIRVSYSSDYAERWLEIEDKLRRLLAGFAVPSPVSDAALRPQKVAECPDAGLCTAWDRLP